MKNFSDRIRSNYIVETFIKPIYFGWVRLLNLIGINVDICNLMLYNGEKTVFLFGIPTSSNMGDMAQYYLIVRWIKENYIDYSVKAYPSQTILHKKCRFLDVLENKIKDRDIIIFQSGYNTHDLGGFEDIMHKAVISKFNHHKMVMMPQTVFFHSPEREKQSSVQYSMNSGMLFLARDKVSLEKAIEMFPKLRIELFPDIVTTLIGQYHFDYKRRGVLLCVRNDLEKFYSVSEMRRLEKKLQKISKVDRCDTTISVPNMIVRRNVKKYLDRMLRKFAQHKLIITDRYHGTIFSLISGTPVIVLKSTDHKVITGLEWFDHIYDEYIYNADSIDDAYNIAERVLRGYSYSHIKPYFKEAYYDKLKELIQ